MTLSIEKKLPLYSDDRVIQIATLNDKSQIKGFSTDIFIDTLYYQKKLSIEELTNIYFQLISWRYKFVVPPTDVLEYLAAQYFASPPGDELRTIAMYAHKCMCDPGLFCGPEKTAHLPLPIAAKLYIDWLNLTTDFIVKCWTNPNSNEKSADIFTDWALLNLLPSVPKYMADGGYRLANMTKRMVLGHAITQLMTFGDIDIGNKVLLLLKHKLDLNDIEYNRVVSETLDAI